MARRMDAITRMARAAIAAGAAIPRAQEGPRKPQDETEASGRPLYTFDPEDGRRRVIITVDADGTFAAPAWFGMQNLGDNGLLDAQEVAIHGALILAQLARQSQANNVVRRREEQNGHQSASAGGTNPNGV